MLSDAPGNEQLRQQRASLHHEVDRAEDAHLLGAVREQLGHQPRLLEVEKGTRGGQQQNEGGDAQQVGRPEHPRQTAEGIASNRATRIFSIFGPRPAGTMHFAPGHQSMLERHGNG